MFAPFLTKEHAMPAEPISMRKLKDILRLKYENKLSNRKIGKSLSIPPGTVSTYINRAKLMGIESWPLSSDWNDIKLSQHFLQTKIKPRTAIPLPNWSNFYQELKQKGDDPAQRSGGGKGDDPAKKQGD